MVRTDSFQINNMKLPNVLSTGLSALVAIAVSANAAPNDRQTELSSCAVTIGLVQTSPAPALFGGIDNRTSKVVKQRQTKGVEGESVYTQTDKIQAVKVSAKVTNATLIDALKRAYGRTGEFRIIAIPAITQAVNDVTFPPDAELDSTSAVTLPSGRFSLSYTLWLDEINQQNPEPLGTLRVGNALTYSISSAFVLAKDTTTQSSNASGSITWDNGGVNFTPEATLTAAIATLVEDPALTEKQNKAILDSKALLEGFSSLAGSVTGGAAYVGWSSDSEKLKINDQSLVLPGAIKFTGSGEPAAGSDARMTGTISIGKQTVKYLVQ